MKNFIYKSLIVFSFLAVLAISAPSASADWNFSFGNGGYYPYGGGYYNTGYNNYGYNTGYSNTTYNPYSYGGGYSSYGSVPTTYNPYAMTSYYGAAYPYGVMAGNTYSGWNPYVNSYGGYNSNYYYGINNNCNYYYGNC